MHTVNISCFSTDCQPFLTESSNLKRCCEWKWLRSGGRKKKNTCCLYRQSSPVWFSRGVGTNCYFLSLRLFCLTRLPNRNMHAFKTMHCSNAHTQMHIFRLICETWSTFSSQAPFKMMRSGV